MLRPSIPISGLRSPRSSGLQTQGLQPRPQGEDSNPYTSYSRKIHKAVAHCGN
jgi:hypothetical protein